MGCAARLHSQLTIDDAPASICDPAIVSLCVVAAIELLAKLDGAGEG